MTKVGCRKEQLDTWPHVIFLLIALIAVSNYQQNILTLNAKYYVWFISNILKLNVGLNLIASNVIYKFTNVRN